MPLTDSSLYDDLVKKSNSLEQLFLLATTEKQEILILTAILALQHLAATLVVNEDELYFIPENE